jgi:hypothetical protein
LSSSHSSLGRVSRYHWRSPAAATNGDPARIVDYPVAIALLVLSVISVIYLLRRSRMRFDSDSDNHSDRD